MRFLRGPYPMPDSCWTRIVSCGVTVTSGSDEGMIGVWRGGELCRKTGLR